MYELCRPPDTMNCYDFLEELFTFDAKQMPQGLYASTKQQIWSQCFYPLLKSKGYNIRSASPGDDLRWSKEGVECGSLKFINSSEVKVRKFGDSYHHDKTVNISRKWQKKRVEKMIHELRREASDSVQKFLILVVFGDTVEPYRRDFVELDRSLDLQKLGITMDERVWGDAQKRGIYSRVRIYQYTDVNKL